MNHTQIVIFGGTGDLSRRKLFHALLDLYIRGRLPEAFSIIGIARGEYDDNSYREFIAEALTTHEHEHATGKVAAFCEHISYLRGSFVDAAFYPELQEKLDREANTLFYLAVPPSLYETIFQHLHDHGLAEQTDDHYTRVLVEKPFGHDYESARKLDTKLGSLFAEDQIFRIDHYLAKEAVQNLLSFRFANTFFNPVWNKDHIKSVHITMHETIDVGTRASFYEGVGALRDVGQNHLLQLLALVAMDMPDTLDAEHIRANRTVVLENLQPETPQTIADHVYRAQYEGYTDVDDVDDNSDTETYFALKTYINTAQWSGVPFTISAGKGLSEALVSVEITFKDVATGPFETDSCETAGNRICLTISPNQSMHMTLNAKAPGLGYQIESRTLTFECNKGDEEITNAYEKVLLDCLEGDQTLFTTTDEVLAAWRYVTSILENWDSTPLHTYQKGTAPTPAILDTSV